MSLTKPMKEVSLTEILDQYNLIVPEIQREYVWGLNQYGVFETFLKDIKEGFQTDGDESNEIKSLRATIVNPAVDEISKENLKTLLLRMVKPQPTMNIGFLYSYKPGYYIGNDREEDLYLIDGQQRFTTLFLVLFYFSLKEFHKKEFLLLFKFDAAKEKIAFDYRVRSITHQFIIDLIEKSETVADLLTVRKKRWFLASYANDTTIKSIVGIDEKTGVFNILSNCFQNDERQYFNFVQSNIKFWHFKTEETSQGEELYITMNSRGQQLADNETIRAKLFDDEEVKTNSMYWSEQWELWQDFFWKHRNRKKETVTADEGFNEFLRWVQILNMWKNELRNLSPIQSTILSFETMLQWPKNSKLSVNYLSLPDIELTFKALTYLYRTFNISQLQYKNKYPKSYINKALPPEWISTDGNPVGIISLFQLLPILLYCKKSLVVGDVINDHALFRLVRAFGTLGKDTTIGKAIRNQVANILTFTDKLLPSEDLTAILQKTDISKTVLNEEFQSKLELMAQSNQRERLEDLIWFAEDIRINNGEILQLIKLTKSIQIDDKVFDLDIFEKVVNGFVEAMKNREEINGNILHTDCYYDLWDRVERSYDWYKRMGLLTIIKNRVLSADQTLSKILLEQQKNFVRQYQTISEIKAETHGGKQLYIYYILSTNNILTVKPTWNWDGNYNFGKLAEGDLNALFDKNIVFQHYNAAFRENENRILEIHRFSHRNAFESLLSWAST